jgi:hypothetical protein
MAARLRKVNPVTKDVASSYKRRYVIALTRAPRQIKNNAAHTFANFCQDAEMVRDEFEVCCHVCCVQVWLCGASVGCWCGCWCGCL